MNWSVQVPIHGGSGVAFQTFSLSPFLVAVHSGRRNSAIVPIPRPPAGQPESHCEIIFGELTWHCFILIFYGPRARSSMPRSVEVTSAMSRASGLAVVDRQTLPSPPLQPLSVVGIARTKKDRVVSITTEYVRWDGVRSRRVNGRGWRGG